MMKPLNQFKQTPILLTGLALLYYWILPVAQAVVPPPDGGYPNFNTAEGQNALMNLTTGAGNTAVGFSSLFTGTTASFNTGVGAGTLLANTADNNTATGAGALLNNTTGENNTASGVLALFDNTTGGSNTATGFGALGNNTTGGDNTANGVNALLNNTAGGSNTANGASALLNNSTGNQNTATGLNALNHNTAGGGNTANGSTALANNTTGNNNTAAGVQALLFNTTGIGNTAVGSNALQFNTTGGGNIALGQEAGFNVSTANNVTCIGANVAGADVSNTTWIAGVYGVTTQSGTTAPVIVSDTGQLGTAVSSERFKKDIATMEKASEAILSLRPVTFHYKTDTKGTPQFGLIAEEVAKVNPGLVLPDKEGKPYTVRYDQVNAMLLNEFLKARRQIGTQQKQIEALTEGLQKVSVQLELRKPASQTVLNSQ